MLHCSGLIFTSRLGSKQFRLRVDISGLQNVLQGLHDVHSSNTGAAKHLSIKLCCFVIIFLRLYQCNKLKKMNNFRNESASGYFKLGLNCAKNHKRIFSLSQTEVAVSITTAYRLASVETASWLKQTKVKLLRSRFYVTLDMAFKVATSLRHNVLLSQFACLYQSSLVSFFDARIKNRKRISLASHSY